MYIEPSKKIFIIRVLYGLRFLSVDEIADFMGFSQGTTYNMLRGGRVTAKVLDGVERLHDVDAVQILKWIEELTIDLYISDIRKIFKRK